MVGELERKQGTGMPNYRKKRKITAKPKKWTTTVQATVLLILPWLPALRSVELVLG